MDARAFFDTLRSRIIERELRRRLPETLIAALDISRIDIDPDPLLLAGDLVPHDVVERRLRQLRVTGVFPHSDRPLVVEGDVPEGLAQDVVRLDAALTIEDGVAMIANGRALAGRSQEAAIVAYALGVPFVPLEGTHVQPSGDIAKQFDLLAEDIAKGAGTDLVALLRDELASLQERYEVLQRSHQRVHEKAALERAVYAETLNRFHEGEMTPADVLGERVHFLRVYSEERHAREIAERRIARLEPELARLAAENERNQQVLRTHVVAFALRVQRWLASLRGE